MRKGHSHSKAKMPNASHYLTDTTMNLSQYTVRYLQITARVRSDLYLVIDMIRDF